MARWRISWRHPKTTNEKRQYYKSAPTLVRARRKPRALPDSWEDITEDFSKSWKHQKKQPRQHGRNQDILRKIKRQHMEELPEEDFLEQED